MHSKKVIQELFEKGSSFYLYPFKVVFSPVYPSNQAGLSQFLVSVSKKKFKKAVDRNKIKRRIKEAYRLNKYMIQSLEMENRPLNLALIYTGKDIPEFAFLEVKIKKVLSKLKELNPNQTE